MKTAQYLLDTFCRSLGKSLLPQIRCDVLSAQRVEAELLYPEQSHVRETMPNCLCIRRTKSFTKEAFEEVRKTENISESSVEFTGILAIFDVLDIDMPSKRGGRNTGKMPLTVNNIS